MVNKRNFAFGQMSLIENCKPLGILMYFEDNFIGGKISRNRRSHLRFTISMWKCFSRIKSDLSCTSNVVEGRHSAFHVRTCKKVANESIVI